MTTKIDTTIDYDGPVEAFAARVTLIREHLEALRMVADGHFDCQPEQVNRGDLGFITDVEKARREIADRVFQRGEYAVTR